MHSLCTHYALICTICNHEELLLNAGDGMAGGSTAMVSSTGGTLANRSGTRAGAGSGGGALGMTAAKAGLKDLERKLAEVELDR